MNSDSSTSPHLSSTSYSSSSSYSSSTSSSENSSNASTPSPSTPSPSNASTPSHSPHSPASSYETLRGEVIPITNGEEIYTVLETIYSGPSTYVTRASHGDNTYIIKSNLKLLHNPKKIRKYFKEYSIGSSIRNPYVVHFCNFKRLGYGFAIIMEDIGGIQLKNVIPPKGFTIPKFLGIALRIVEGLGAIHEANVAHKDINPFNIVVNLKTKALNIIDFGKASQCHITGSTHAIAIKNRVPHHGVVRGSFMYMSPEQTGRMNSGVDYRTDFYSLGMTFYEMLTGETPFANSNSPDLIYKHIAVHPKPLVTMKPEIGTALSDIVAKMLAKNVEDRYQDCKGLKADLLAIQRSIKSRIPLQGFVAGSRDHLRQLRISQKLYGKEKEVELLSKSFRRICEQAPNASTLVLVHGVSGVGKTLLVHEVYRPLAKQNGYYICGKFDQLAATPLTALIQALQQLVQHILTESEESLLCWKENIIHGLGKNGQLIVDHIPELEMIIGPQPPVLDVGAIETVHRFNYTFSAFIFSLAIKQPLVIFLDDLQWADCSMYSILTTLLNPENTERDNPNYLFIVGTYRDNEVSPTHPLSLALHEVKRKTGRYVDILLHPLKECEVVQMLDDTFNMHTKRESLRVDAQALGRLVYIKTRGNPFFINQLLLTLHKDGHIRPIEFNEETGWVCNMEAIQLANYTSNVVDLMVSSLRALPSKVQTMMGMAAIIGTQFEATLLARLCELPEHYIETSLREAVRDGFLVPSTDQLLCPTLEEDMQTGEIVLVNMSTHLANLTKPTGLRNSGNYINKELVPTYFFAHDRIQQAAACLLSRDDQIKVHLKLAEQLLIHAKSTYSINTYLLSIAHHMNIGLENHELTAANLPPLNKQIIAEDIELYLPFNVYSAANINFLSALKAKGNNAFQLAHKFVEQCINYLEIDIEVSWRDQYGLCMDSYMLYADLQNITGILTLPRCDHLLDHAKTNIEKAEICNLLHIRYEAESNMKMALTMVLKGLDIVGLPLPEDEKEQELEFVENIKLFQEKITYANISDLLNLPLCTDKEQLIIFKLLSTAWISCYVMGKKFLTCLLSSRTVLRSIDHGACASTGKSLACYALHGLPYVTDYAFLHEVAKAGLEISDSRFAYDKTECGCTYVFYGCGIASYVMPLPQVVKYMETAFQLFKQAGNTIWLTYMECYLFELPIFYGSGLKEILDNQYKRSNIFWSENGMKSFENQYRYTQCVASPLHELRGKPCDLLGGENYEDSIFYKIPVFRCSYCLAKMFTGFIMRKRDNLLNCADIIAHDVTDCFQGLYKLIEAEMIAGLVFIDWLGTCDLAWQIFADKKKQKCNVKWDSSEYETPNEDIKEQQENLYNRVKYIGDYIKHMMHATKYCSFNFFHKAYLLRAELARVALMFDSDAIYEAAKVNELSGFYPKRKSTEVHSFEEAMQFYEAAIESAQKDGFQQYEAIALELYGIFWLTAPEKPHIRFSLMYLSEAIMVYERWGATVKAQLLRQNIARISSYDPCVVNRPVRRRKLTTVSSLDLDAMVQSSQTISSEVDFNTLVIKMVKAIVENANAQRGTFFLGEEEPNGKVQLWVCAEYYQFNSPQLDIGVVDKGITLMQPQIELSKWKNGPHSVVNYVRRMLRPVVLKCAHSDPQFGLDEYIARQQVKSVICMPILLKNTLKGVMYIENNLCDGLYNHSRVDLLKVLTSQMAISLENIHFLHDQMAKQSQEIIYEHLQKEEKIQRERADAAEKYKTQLENFIDMICHEIRNPLNGIFGNTDLIITYLASINEILDKAKQTGKRPTAIKEPEFTPKSPSLAAITSFREVEDKSDTGLLRYLLDQVMQSTESIQKCAEHQKCMTDDVLHLSRLRSHKLAITNRFYQPWDTIRTVTSIFKQQTDAKGLYLNVVPEGDYSGVELFGDAVRVYQIISNFLSNAMKFTHQGGITITFSITDSEPESATSPRLQSSRSGKNIASVREKPGLSRSASFTSPKFTSFPPASPSLPSHSFSSTSTPISPIAAINPMIPAMFTTNPTILSTSSTPINLSSPSSPISSTSSPSSLSSPSALNISNSSIPSTPTLIAPTTPTTPTLIAPTTPTLSELSKIQTLADIQNRKTTPCIFKVEVKDTGIGMTTEEQGRIFKRFSQANSRTSQEYGGSGLGLAICRKLAKLMNGSISLKSEVGKGSTFTLTIPSHKAVPSPSILMQPAPSSLLPDPSSSSSFPSFPTSFPTSLSSSSLPLLRSDSSSSLTSSSSSTYTASPPGTPTLSSSTSSLSPRFSSPASVSSISPILGPNIENRVLIVEDNIVNQSVLTRVLKLRGYEVEVANNGQEALDKFIEKGKEGKGFGFVLMDMMMPVMDGVTSSNLIRKHEAEAGWPRCKIFGLSGNARDEYRQTALNAGMDEYITKPYHKDVLYRLLADKLSP